MQIDSQPASLAHAKHEWAVVRLKRGDSQLSVGILLPAVDGVRLELAQSGLQCGQGAAEVDEDDNRFTGLFDGFPGQVRKQVLREAVLRTGTRLTGIQTAPMLFLW